MDFSNVISSGVDKDSLKMTVVKGSKLTTEKSLKVVSFEVSDKKAVKVKLGKDGVASIKPKKNGWVKLTMEDGNTYTVTFTVETPKPVKAAKKMLVSDEKKTLTLKDLFNIESLDQGELSITGGNSKNQAAVVVSENKLVVTPKEPDSVKLQYKYLNKKYKTNIKIK